MTNIQTDLTPILWRTCLAGLSVHDYHTCAGVICEAVRLVHSLGYGAFVRLGPSCPNQVKSKAKVILWAIFTLLSRQQLRRARKRGLWSPLGQIPTDEDVARLAKAGETILAIRMCRQIHNLDLAEAKAVVEKMAEPGVRR